MNKNKLLIKKAVVGIFLVVFGLIYVIKINPISLNVENEKDIIFETFEVNETKIVENTSQESVNLNDEIKASKKTININTCSKEELILLPGIGEKTAANIIKYREENGGFKSITHIKNVRRIGEKTYEKIKDMISVE